MEKNFFLNPSSIYGRKRRFGIAGLINILITNGVLQILIYLSILNIGFCTLISQIFNFTIGYFLYGKVVFNVQIVRNRDKVFRYIYLSSILWLLNWIGIGLIYEIGINRNLAALIMMFPLSMISFVSQKYLIFKQ